MVLQMLFMISLYAIDVFFYFINPCSSKKLPNALRIVLVLSLMSVSAKSVFVFANCLSSNTQIVESTGKCKISKFYDRTQFWELKSCDFSDVESSGKCKFTNSQIQSTVFAIIMLTYYGVFWQISIGECPICEMCFSLGG